MTKKQPSAMPTRKVWAMVLSGIAVAGAQVLADKFLPGADLDQVWPHLDIALQGSVMFAFAYMAEEWDA